MKQKRREKIIFITNVLCLLMLLLPYSEVVDVENSTYEEKTWEYLFVEEDEIILFIFTVFNIFWFLYQGARIKVVKLISKDIFLCIGALIFWAACWGGLLFPSSDSIPSFGLVLSLLFFPISLLIVMSEKDYNI